MEQRYGFGTSGGLEAHDAVLLQCELIEVDRRIKISFFIAYNGLRDVARAQKSFSFRSVRSKFRFEFELADRKETTSKREFLEG